MQVSKARGLNVSSQEDKALTVRRTCSACCSIEGDYNEEGKQLNFIQHDARLLATVQHVLGSLQSLSNNLRKLRRHC